jgi:hypothetical protein
MLTLVHASPSEEVTQPPAMHSSHGGQTLQAPPPTPQALPAVPSSQVIPFQQPVQHMPS